MARRERTSVRAVLHEYRPSVVTGGASAVPLLVLAAMNFADEFDRIAFGVLLPEIQDHFGVSLTTILTVSSLAGLLPVLLSVPIGYLSDRLRRTRLIAAGGTLWGSFSILTGMDPAHASLLADYYPPSRRAGVFAVHRLGNEIGQIVAPLTAGALASLLFWQVPFLLFGLPAFVLAAVVLVRLRDPARGAQERLVLGADDESALIEDTPPSWSEAWRAAKGIRTLRRVWAALPFLVGSALGTAALLSVYYDDIFDVGGLGRGVLTSLTQTCNLIGIVVGGSIGNRMMARRPSRVVTLGGLIAVIPAICYAGIALSPFLALSVFLQCAAAASISFFSPTMNAIISLVIPARVRAFAFGVAAIFIAPGILVAPLAGALGDAYGIRAGILLLAPIFAIGAFILASAGQTVDDDVRAATAAALAQQESRAAKAEGRTKLLICKDVDVSYGPVQVLFNVDLEIEQGEIVALLGTNGAGKSTLLRAIGGDTSASNGAIIFDGEDITHLPSKDHVAKGIVQVPGGKGVFPSLTVAQNLQLAAWTVEDDAEVAAATERVFEFFPKLRERSNEAAGNLSGGEQQMLTLGQAFLSKPKLLMIDELSLGLAPVVVEELLGIVRALHEAGTTIVLVEQSVNVALTVAERAVFMEKGEVRFSGPTAELLQRSDILRSVFLSGTGAGSAAKRRRSLLPGEEHEIVLEVTGLSKTFGGVVAVDGVDITLRQGEILGLIGPNGAGKTTLFDLISGYVTPSAGRVGLLGEDLGDLTPDQRASMGLHRSFQDARLFGALTVEENLLVALDRHLTVRNPVLGALRLPNVRSAETQLRKRADRLIGMLNLEQFRDKFVRELSTGTRRVVDLACVLASDPIVLLLDEPSSGIAQRESEELGPLLQRIKLEADCSILIIEHDMSLISSVSDELIALETGRVVLRGTPEAVLADPRVIASYLGSNEAVIGRTGARAGT
jgi:ABC-type branched-subunit amino acid transport system ATPase component/MFS family permease